MYTAQCPWINMINSLLSSVFTSIFLNKWDPSNYHDIFEVSASSKILIIAGNTNICLLYFKYLSCLLQS